MNVQVNEDFVGVLATDVIADSVGEKATPSYPQVPLRLGTEEKEHQIGLIWLQSRFLRVAICPQLGGRIVAIHDLRTSTDILKVPDRLKLVEGGIRGVEGRFGVEFLAGSGRRNSLGAVDFRVIEAASETGKAAVMLFEMDGDLSWHGAVTLPPDRAVIILEQKIQNRAWVSNVARSGIVIHGVDGGGLDIVDPDGDMGWRDEGEFATMPIDGRLGGRRIDEWRVEMVPYSGIGEFRCGDTAVSIGVDEDSLHIQAHGDTSDYKVFLQVNGQTLESAINQKVGSLNSTDLTQLPGVIEAIAVRDSAGASVAQWPPVPFVDKIRKFKFPHNELDILIDQMDDSVKDIERIMGLEALTRELLAVGRVRTQEWGKADEAMEKFLAYHAEDGLGWWLKASIKRERGRERTDEDRELPNAHYLMPLEPLLKAEAFLNTAVAEGREPNPLLKTIADDPGVAAAVVEMYHRCWLRQGMARLAEELLRHKESPMIRYFLADAYLSNPRLTASAAEHVFAVENLDIEPPFPHRKNDITVIERLAERFADSNRLNQLVKLIEMARSKGYLRVSSLE
ncbi:MAG: hypothetical protein ACKVQS_01770 [Fimbriimonadaceae bacterium]